MYPVRQRQLSLEDTLLADAHVYREAGRIVFPMKFHNFASLQLLAVGKGVVPQLLEPHGEMVS